MEVSTHLFHDLIDGFIKPPLKVGMDKWLHST